MKKEMMPPVVDRPLDQRREITHKTAASERHGKLGKVFVFAAVAGIAAGGYMERQSGPEGSSFTSFNYQVNPGDTLSGVIDENCSIDPNSKDGLEMKSLSMDANDMATEYLDRDDTITVVLSTDHCTVPSN